MRPDSRTRTQPVVLALVTDIVCVVVFCTAGRPVTVPPAATTYVRSRTPGNSNAAGCSARV